MKINILALIILSVYLIKANIAMAASNSKCQEQNYQRFMTREFILSHPERDVVQANSIKYRIKNYGHLEGFSYAELNPIRAWDQVEEVLFFYLPITVHEKMAPVLKCVEEEIILNCVGDSNDYTPVRLSGLRKKNSYRGGEISNHMFGLAIDIDPHINPCCGCVPPWSDHPSCRTPGQGPFERAKIPRCWVNAFEKYGFYWLGRDRMQDTMHFEFLGDPDKVFL